MRECGDAFCAVRADGAQQGSGLVVSARVVSKGEAVMAPACGSAGLPVPRGPGCIVSGVRRRRQRHDSHHGRCEHASWVLGRSWAAASQGAGAGGPAGLFPRAVINPRQAWCLTAVTGAECGRGAGS